MARNSDHQAELPALLLIQRDGLLVLQGRPAAWLSPDVCQGEEERRRATIESWRRKCQSPPQPRTVEERVTPAAQARRGSSSVNLDRDNDAYSDLCCEASSTVVSLFRSLTKGRRIQVVALDAVDGARGR